MTTNQIAYQSLQETIRSNQAKEGELFRSNVARETETERSNKVREAETERSNKAREQETARHNRADEGIRIFDTTYGLVKDIGGIAALFA